MYAMHRMHNAEISTALLHLLPKHTIAAHDTARDAVRVPS